MWTPTTREQHNRKAPRYQTDLTDAVWAAIEPHLPPPRGTGRPRSWPMREIVKRSDAAKGFEVLPRRWVVERTLA